MHENEVSGMIVDASYRIHSKLGPGLFERVYEVLLAHEMAKNRLDVQRQVPVPIEYDGIKFDEGFAADLIVHDRVLVELKSIEKLLPVHKKQVLTYLKLTGLKLGLLMHFGEEYIKDGIVRIVNGLPE